jgi:hypothetical protein
MSYPHSFSILCNHHPVVNSLQWSAIPDYVPQLRIYVFNLPFNSHQIHQILGNSMKLKDMWSVLAKIILKDSSLLRCDAEFLG